MSSSKDKIVINVNNEFVVCSLVKRLQQDMSQLQTAIIRENKHDVGVHIENMNGRLNELAERVNLPGASLGGAQ